MGNGSIISAIAVPHCSEPVPLRIFWSGYGPACNWIRCVTCLS